MQCAKQEQQTEPWSADMNTWFDIVLSSVPSFIDVGFYSNVDDVGLIVNHRGFDVSVIFGWAYFAIRARSI